MNNSTNKILQGMAAMTGHSNLMPQALSEDPFTTETGLVAKTNVPSDPMGYLDSLNVKSVDQPLEEMPLVDLSRSIGQTLEVPMEQKKEVVKKQLAKKVKKAPEKKVEKESRKKGILELIGEGGLYYRGKGARARQIDEEKTLKDPNSDISKITQNIASQLTGRDMSNVNAWTLKQTMPDLFKMAQMQMQRQQQMMSGGGLKGKELTQNMIYKISEGKNIPTMMKRLDEAVEKYGKEMGPVFGRLKEINPYSTKAQEFNAVMRTVKQMVGKWLEKGVLRKEDEEKYKKIFPKMSDTKAVAKAKVKELTKMLTEDYKAMVSTFEKQGYDLTGLTNIQPEISKKNSDPLGILGD